MTEILQGNNLTNLATFFHSQKDSLNTLNTLNTLNKGCQRAQCKRKTETRVKKQNLQMRKIVIMWQFFFDCGCLSVSRGCFRQYLAFFAFKYFKIL